MPSSPDGGAAPPFPHETYTTAVKSPRQLFQERINSLLSAPMPRCLQSSFHNEGLGGARFLEMKSGNEGTDGTRLPSSRSAGAPRAANDVTSVGEATQSETTRNAARATVNTFHVNEASAPSPRVPIYEQLLQKGRLQQERLEQLRQEAMEREMRELRPAPRIQLAPTALPVEPLQPARRLPPEGQRIEDKLLQRAKDKAEQERQAAQLRREREEEDLAAVATFHPHISAHAQATKARYKEPPADRAAWRAKRLEELAQIRQSAELEDLQELQQGPAINRHSAKLAAAKKAREGLEGLPASETLFITEYRRRFAQLQAAEAEHEVREQASPAITHRAAAMHRLGDVGSRLHAESYAAAIRRLQREVTWREAHTPFQPEVTTLAAVTAPRYQRESDAGLHAARSSPAFGGSALPRRNSTTRDAFQPSINPVSAAIAERLPETPMQRLCRSSAVHSLSSYVDPSHSHDTSVCASMATPRQPTQGRLDMTGDTTARRPGPSLSSSAVTPPPPLLPSAVVASLDAYERRRQARLDALRWEQREQELRECTFQPRVNARSAALAADAPHSTSGDRRGPAAVAQRNKEWQQRRDEHMETMRQWQAERAAAAEAKAEQIESRVLGRAAAAQALSPSLYGGDGQAWGVNAYLDRQQRAHRQRRELQERQDAVQQATSSVKPSRPVSVAAATPLRDYRPVGASAIRSLRPPVSASETWPSAQLWTSDV
ncbi:hypothetical protein ABB37_04838 [Leptomonas pyrrhocoris]|uniref:Uncharacterized protein n=1 Tax=Leptomonas pyrrhocoris TaxID=157538 RepID=A0A0N0VFG4_LEPPY|nr:hypothetical protein ABB37_04838 [Leptomonas pyrrhocoris]KPA80651.1 hypothetical protein ABB37_04838 [Leptomonas pyrrhocoris]|eukprot:XP_015659090.1 hypothetical protein ABB37_04838 [Leptomonas pyrrhocoris]